MSESIQDTSFVELAADIVSAYVSNNSVPTSELPELISSVHASLAKIHTPTPTVAQVTKPDPIVPIRKSITPDHLICLLDGLKFKSLKRHLRTKYDMSPEQYREMFGLPFDYPMVAPNYAQQRSDLAKSMGLGQAARKAAAKRK